MTERAFREPKAFSPTVLRVLVVEDREDDALLSMRHLERNGYSLQWERVEEAGSLRAALERRSWDVILSDWSLPRFSAPEALRIVKDSGLDIPFVIVSGTVRENTAVEAMHAGAHDYIMKDNLARLAAAVGRELREFEERKARRRAEETLARTEKLRALGQMAAGVAHDLKNIYSPLFLYLEVVARALDRREYDQAKGSLAEMKQVLSRGLEAIERLRQYGRQSPEALEDDVDLDRLVRESIAIASARLTCGAVHSPRIRAELSGPRPFRGNAGDIVSALVNLIVNSIDALTATEGGTITLRTGEREQSERWVEVADDGPGMPPEVAQRALEPFFTTKGERGTGLGLAMVQACMQRHRGSVELDTTPGRGTTVTLRFPDPHMRRSP
ncbi:MAG TPA: hybrid sensor histidine kinase/response regulator [Polyangiaceae bacterium]|nr:hybrid sensor histidine kinase/response regulator [Polyangiaceae bacterium]